MASKVHFQNLDVLRFVCAFAVAITHSYEAYFGWLGEPDFIKRFPQIKPYLDLFIGNLSLGVPMFFLISGFLITYLLLVEKQQEGNIHIGKFIIRRSLRIWPLYYLAVLIGFLMVTFSSLPIPNLWSNLLFWNNFNTLNTLQWQYPFAHFWSLSIEEHFYLVWPFIVYFIPIKRLIWVIALLMLGAVGFRYFVPHYYAQEQIQYALYLHTFSRIDDILIGALLAWVHFKKPIRLNTPTWLRIIVYIVFIIYLFITSSVDYWEWGIYSVMFKKYIYLVIIAFWLLNYLFNPNAFGNFKHKNVLHYLGKISFGIYVYHNMIINVYISKIVYKWGIHNMFVYFVCYFAILFLLSALSYELYEKHFLKLKNKFALVKTER